MLQFPHEGMIAGAHQGSPATGDEHVLGKPAVAGIDGAAGVDFDGRGGEVVGSVFRTFDGVLQQLPYQIKRSGQISVGRAPSYFFVFFASQICSHDSRNEQNGNDVGFGEHDFFLGVVSRRQGRLAILIAIFVKNAAVEDVVGFSHFA